MQLAIPDEQLQQLREFYGFDKPFLEAYGTWLYQTVQLDLGQSFRYNEPVIQVIADRFPVSIYYGLVTAFFILRHLHPARHPQGDQAPDAGRQPDVGADLHRLRDTGICAGRGAGQHPRGAVPDFSAGRISVARRGANCRSLQRIGDIVWHSVLPLIAYLVGAFALETMLMKNSLMENMSSDYVRTALAKGLNWRRAVFVHALRNSLIPMATSIGGLLGIFLTGSVLIERVFDIQGVGLLAFEAIQARDFPVVMGFLVISSMVLMLGNLISDLAVAFVDPRVRFE